jgi:PAS domain S-box-containing protein
MNLRAGRLNIGPRLVVGFGLIIAAMSVADAVVLWQFRVVANQAGRLRDIDQARIAVLRVHTSLLAFHNRLDALADSKDASGLVKEAGQLRATLPDDISRATGAVSLLPAQLQRDPTILPTLHVVQSTVRSELNAITTLAAAGDWRAVQLQLTNQIRSLESVTSTLVEKVDQEVSAVQAQTAENLQRVQQRVFLIVPLTALLTLMIAATMGLAITRSITHPLVRLVEGSQALARGEFHHRVAIGGDDELARLGQVFNDTAQRLRDLYATLQRSEDRLRLVIDTIPAHVWSALPDGSVDFINRRWQESTGLPVEAGLGWDWSAIVHPEDLSRFVAAWETALAAGAPMESEARLRRAGGEYRWWLIRNVPLRDDQRNVINWYGTAVDIEDRHRVEDALRVSEERWRNLVAGAPVGIALTDMHGRYVSANPALQRMMGYSETELRGLRATDITHEDDRVTTEAMITATAAGKPPTRVTKRYRHKDGGVIWAEVSGFPIPREGNAPLLAGIVVDITDRKRAEDELRRSEASLGDAQQISHTGSWRWQIATGEVSLSEELRRMLAVDPAIPLPSAAAFIATIHADDRRAFEETVERAVQARMRFEHEYRLVLADDSIKRLHIFGRPDVSGSGELEYTGVVMDVTERRRAEEALRDTQAELTRAARLTTMGELVASLSHELRQPLAAIVMNGSATLRWLSREPPDLEEARDAATRIVREGQRADEVIRGLRALAKKSGLQMTALDVDDVVNEVLALTRGELHRHGVTLRVDLATGSWPVRGDRVQLQQVLLNLILNGIDAMRAVTAHTRELTVSSTLAETGSVRVSVEDTGAGLDPELAQRIFEPFFTTKADGLGMGLSICRSIIEAHGGELWMLPRIPRGTAFHFTVPVSVG